MLQLQSWSTRRRPEKFCNFVLTVIPDFRFLGRRKCPPPLVHMFGHPCVQYIKSTYIQNGLSLRVASHPTDAHAHAIRKSLTDCKPTSGTLFHKIDQVCDRIAENLIKHLVIHIPLTCSLPSQYHYCRVATWKQAIFLHRMDTKYNAAIQGLILPRRLAKCLTAMMLLRLSLVWVKVRKRWDTNGLHAFVVLLCCVSSGRDQGVTVRMPKPYL